jgi:hypothetical protein
MPENQVESPASAAPQLADPLTELTKISGAPSRADVDAHKRLHGDVFVSFFSETEAYLWRALKRGEYRSLQEAAASNTDQLKLEEAIVEKCVIWPKLDKTAFDSMKAGTFSTLSGQIMENSNFMAPPVAAQLVFKL